MAKTEKQPKTLRAYREAVHRVTQKEERTELDTLRAYMLRPSTPQAASKEAFRVLMAAAKAGIKGGTG